MKKNKVEDTFKELDKYLHEINSIVGPFSYRSDLEAVMDKNTRHNLYEKNPRCFMPIRLGNKDIPFLPICNRNGATDKNMVAFSLKLANKLLDREDVDRGLLTITIKKLEDLSSNDDSENLDNIKTSLNTIESYLHILKGE